MTENFDAHILADRQASATELADLQTRIDGDPQLKREYHTVLLLKDTLSRHCTPVSDQAAWQSCRERLNAIDRTRKAERFVSKNAYYLVGGLAAMIIGVGFLQRQGASSATFTADQVPQLAAALNPLRDADGGNQSQQALQSARMPLRILQAYSGLYQGTPISAVDFTDGASRMKLISIEGKTELQGFEQSRDRSYQFGVMNGNNCVAWTENGRTFLLLGNKHQIQLEAVAGGIRSGQ